MTDGIIKGTGNSRYIKTVANALALYPTYEAFMQAFAAGEVLIDLNGINQLGWDTIGDKLGKETLLKDETAQAAGLTTDAVPDDVLAWLIGQAKGIRSIATGGTGNATGNAASATKLQTARTIQTNLASTGEASFNGTANVTPGVTGVLPVANGGTGKTSLSSLATSLVPYLSGASIETGSFTGTGSSIFSITAAFPPKLIIVMSKEGSYSSTFCVAISNYGFSGITNHPTYSSEAPIYMADVSVSGNSITIGPTGVKIGNSLLLNTYRRNNEYVIFG